MKIEVVWATPQVQDVVEVEMSEGSTVADALARSGLLAQYSIDRATLGFSIYGRRSTLDAVLTDGDRVELTRPLEADPKSARAARARKRPPPRPPKAAREHS